MNSTGPEDPLNGGRTTAGVVRVGDTVRRPQGAHSPFVHRLLFELGARGCVFAPRFLGIDDQKREILSYLPGEVPGQLGAFSDSQLDAAARLLRALHDATPESPLRGIDEVVCHGDASPCNAVFLHGMPYAWIDFDSAHPGSRSDDLGYAAWLWLDIGNDDYAARMQARRLARFFAAYGAANRVDPTQSILEAQEKLCRRAGVHQDWARQCRLWTLKHRTVLQASP